MKKSIIAALALMLSIAAGPVITHAGRGGGVAGGFAGGLAGGMIGSSLASRDRGESRAEAEARQAKYEAEQVRYDVLRHQAGRGEQSPLFYLLIFFVLILLVGVGMMSIMLFRRRDNRRQ